MTALARIDIADYLASDPAVYGGWVTIRGRRLPVSRLGLDHVHGMSVEELCENWDLLPAQVHAALSYFFAHRAEIERDVAEYDAESDRIAAAMAQPGPRD
jgi:uncharacterized protein (DUF433 family)